jgi:hypothetical protein
VVLSPLIWTLTCRVNNFFLSRQLAELNIDLPFSSNNVPIGYKISFISVTESEVCNAVMSIKSNAAGVDEIPLSFIKSLLPVLLGTLAHIFNCVFTCWEFSTRWRASCEFF